MGSLSVKSVKSLCEGLIVSKLIMACPLWIGANKTTLMKLQYTYNLTARIALKITKRDRRRTVDIFKDLNWLSIYQLSVYHSILWMKRILDDPTQSYFRDIFYAKASSSRKYISKGNMKLKINTDNMIVNKSWRWKTFAIYNKLPDHIIYTDNMERFKLKLKIWTLDNIDFEATSGCDDFEL